MIILLANLHGHEVLRNPVRHCELNPIGLTWAQVKGFVAKKNTTFRLKDAKELTYAAFGKTTNDLWTVSVAEKGMLCCVRKFWRTAFF
jgi:hypothetical protein